MQNGAMSRMGPYRKSEPPLELKAEGYVYVPSGTFTMVLRTVEDDTELVNRPHEVTLSRPCPCPSRHRCRQRIVAIQVV